MSDIRGIGFDLFGTLVLQEHFTLEQSLDTLIASLLSSGLRCEKGPFVQAYRDVNRRLFAQAAQDGRETHNRFWVAGALQALGQEIEPSDPRIDSAVTAYFEPFIECCRLIPGTREMLERLAGTYDIGLVSNFTHPPAVDSILERLDIRRFFDVILVSGGVGIRKPHPGIFTELMNRLRLPPQELLYVGDELQSDIVGGRRAGMRTVWMTYRQQLEQPSPLEHFLGLSDLAKEAQPDYVIKDWTEFLSILGSV
jgi:putative hydrolase of the HAD superfamily